MNDKTFTSLIHDLKNEAGALGGDTVPDGQAISAPILSADGISKSFGSVPVLFSVSMNIRAGEVHALIGENGAGKSTLMKILSGFLQPTSGHIRVDGAPLELPGNGQSEGLGIVLIHQELNLAEQMTVEENVFLGRELLSRGILDRTTMRALVKGYLNDIGLDISPEDRISDLSIAQKQMVEIVKAMSRDARVLIMDEPTAVLTEAETELFFDQVRRLKARGTAIVFVSHKLTEVSAISDQVTVLRDGQWIGTHAAKDVTPDTMAQMMVGRELSDFYPPMNEVDVDADHVLEVRNLVAPGVHNVSFDLRRGEILGFSGLIGAGRTAVFEAICGLTTRAHGIINFDGSPAQFGSVA